MGCLKELIEMPVVTVNDIPYVPKDKFKEYIISRLEANKKDCLNKDEEDGIEISIQTVFNS